MNYNMLVKMEEFFFISSTFTFLMEFFQAQWHFPPKYLLNSYTALISLAQRFKVNWINKCTCFLNAPDNLSQCK